MTLLESESSEYAGRPVYLYEFTADGESYFLTAYAVPYTFDGDVYLPSAGIKHGNVVRSGAADRPPELTIEVAEAEDVIQENCYDGAPLSFTVRIHKIQPNGSHTWWDGRVGGGAVKLDNDGNMAALRCPSLLDEELERSAPDLFFTEQCQHFLFDSWCQLNALDYDVASTVSSISGVNLTVSSVAGQPDHYFRGGVVLTLAGERRTIVSQLGTALVLFTPFRVAPAPTTTLTLYPGCDRTIATCVSKFNNRVNFGGFPIIPLHNIFARGIRGL